MTKAKELSELASAATVTSGNVALSGGLDVDGVTDLDVVDIDGAVNISAATTIATNNKIQFRDAAIYLNSSADGQLDIVADTEIEMTTPLVEMSGALSVIGNRSGDYQTKLISTNTYGLRIQTTSTSDSHEQLGIYDGSNTLKFKVMGGGTVHATGVNLGGAGAANRLNDYEEGAVSLALTGGNDNPSTAVAITGTYVKIGRLVSIRAQNLNLNNTGAGGPMQLTGFPFAANGAYGIGSIGEVNDICTFTNTPFLVVSGTIGYVYQNISEANAAAVNHHVDTAGAINIDVTYETNS